jgi:hypothetical protein
MKEKIRICALLLAVVFGMMACDNKKEPYIKGAEDEKAIVQFSVITADISATNPLEVIDTIEGVIDEASKTVTLDFPSGSVVTWLVPTIKVSRYATVEPESGVPQNFTQPVYYTVTAYNGTTAQYMVTAVVHDANNEKSILSFRTENPDCEGVINETAKTVTLTYPEDTDVTHLVPMIEVSEGATIEPASGAEQDFTNPVEYTVTAMNGTTAVYVVTAIIQEIPSGPTGKTVLLNDYTGVRCVNCPAASEVAHNLQEQYRDRLIVMSIHAGYLAQPVGSFPDFTTEEGTTWYNNNSSNPLGSVDRVMLLQGHVLQDNDWSDAVSTAMEEAQTVEIRLNNTYNEATRTLTTTIDAQALETLSGELALTVCLVEDGIVGMQVTPSGLQTEYVHRHVFRGTLNGTYGESIQFDGDNQFSKSFSKQIPEIYDESNCYIVAYVYDNSQNMKILQTAMKKIK